MQQSRRGSLIRFRGCCSGAAPITADLQGPHATVFRRSKPSLKRKSRAAQPVERSDQGEISRIKTGRLQVPWLSGGRRGRDSDPARLNARAGLGRAPTPNMGSPAWLRPPYQRPRQPYRIASGTDVCGSRLRPGRARLPCGFFVFVWFPGLQLQGLPYPGKLPEVGTNEEDLPRESPGLD